jgi:hypothetical protein
VTRLPSLVASEPTFVDVDVTGYGDSSTSYGANWQSRWPAAVQRLLSVMNLL